MSSLSLFLPLIEGVGALSAPQMEHNYISERMQTTSSFSLSPFPLLTCCLSHLDFNLSLPLAPSHLFCPFLCWFASTGIDLENIVYYKDDTHYFVMTAKKQSLLEKGVILHVSDQRV